MCGNVCERDAKECANCGEPLHLPVIIVADVPQLQVLAIGLGIVGGLTMLFALIGGIAELLP
jgi:hypothetical protein